MIITRDNIETLKVGDIVTNTVTGATFKITEVKYHPKRTEHPIDFWIELISSPNPDSQKFIGERSGMFPEWFISKENEWRKEGD